jgi:hypothetical protein
MSRKNDSSGVAIVELVLYLPLWVGVFMAAGSCWGLHWYATRSLPTRWGFAETSQMASEAMMRELAGGAQYVLPALLIIATVVAVVRRWKHLQLLMDVAKRAAQTP